jgi:hypothetical protein
LKEIIDAGDVSASLGHPGFVAMPTIQDRTQPDTVL